MSKPIKKMNKMKNQNNQPLQTILPAAIAAIFLLGAFGSAFAQGVGALSEDIVGTWRLDSDATNRFTFSKSGRFSDQAGGAVEKGTYRISDADGILETKVARGTTRFKVKIDGDTMFIGIGNDRLIYKRVRKPNSGSDSPIGASNRRGVDLSTPTKAFAAYYRAVGDRDANLFKRAASSRTLESMSAGVAKQQKAFDDDFIRDYLEKLASKISETPETRNEKINGDRATLEEKLVSGWREVSCVRENGAWKYDSFY